MKNDERDIWLGYGSYLYRPPAGIKRTIHWLQYVWRMAQYGHWPLEKLKPRWGIYIYLRPSFF